MLDLREKLYEGILVGAVGTLLNDHGSPPALMSHLEGNVAEAVR